MKFRILLPVAAAAIAVLSSCSHKPAALTVTPYPNDVTIKCGTFNAAGADFAVDPALDPDSRDIVVAFRPRKHVAGRDSRNWLHIRA